MSDAVPARAAVVTGASSGIGQATARRLARDGFAVVVGYCGNEAGARETAAAIENEGGTATLLRGDLGDAAAVTDFVTRAFAAHDNITAWANLAGADILTGAGAAKSDLEKLDSLLGVDLRGTILASWAAAERLSEGGAIINMSWDLALRGMGGRNPEMFAATKAGITGFTRSLAQSLAPRIRVNEVAPGWIQTRFADADMRDDYYRWVVETTPLARFGQPQEVAAAVAFLASDDAAFITGQTVKVNGGLSS